MPSVVSDGKGMKPGPVAMLPPSISPRLKPLVVSKAVMEVRVAAGRLYSTFREVPEPS